MNGSGGIQMNCNDIREILPAFLADEISAGDSLQVQSHLEGCAPCRKFKSFELAFDATVKRSLVREAAPPSLILGVQRALDGGSIASHRSLPFSGASAWRQWAVAAGIIFAMLAPVTLGYQLGFFVAPFAGTVEEKVLKGTLICSTCERMGVPIDQQRGCRLHGHRAAFKCDETGIWELVDNPGSRELITAATRLGDRLEVTGRFIDDIRYVNVSSYKYISDGRPGVEGL
jgi:hypothetical protein